MLERLSKVISRSQNDPTMSLQSHRGKITCHPYHQIITFKIQKKHENADFTLPVGLGPPLRYEFYWSLVHFITDTNAENNKYIKIYLKGVQHPWALFLKALCIFSKIKASLDKVSYRSGQKYSRELKNHSFIQ